MPFLENLRGESGSFIPIGSEDFKPANLVQAGRLENYQSMCIIRLVQLFLKLAKRTIKPLQPQHNIGPNLIESVQYFSP